MEKFLSCKNCHNASTRTTRVNDLIPTIVSMCNWFTKGRKRHVGPGDDRVKNAQVCALGSQVHRMEHAMPVGYERTCSLVQTFCTVMMELHDAI
jgi:hypothetical protein